MVTDGRTVRDSGRLAMAQASVNFAQVAIFRGPRSARPMSYLPARGCSLPFSYTVGVPPPHLHEPLRLA